MSKLSYISALFLVLALLFSSQLKGQNRTASLSYPATFENEQLLDSVFEKLYQLKTGNRKKVNIVHIGDSHIQADFFTNAVRQQLQAYFGNGGYGFTFPYSIAKTNGTRLIKYSTNIEWETARNIDRSPSVPIGLGGIGLSTSSNSFHITLNADYSYRFNSVKVISSEKESCFSLSKNISKEGTALHVEQPRQITPTSKVTYHEVKSGETLYRLSVNYKVSVEDIKRINNLNSNTIKVGQSVKIPLKGKNNTPPLKQTESTYKINIQDTLQTTYKDYYVEYNSPFPLTEINILPDKKHDAYSLNGVVLENSTPGIIYHAIGINGAKASDFNKYGLFFEQLPALTPDLIIISFGTNESFGRLSDTNFMYEINRLVKNIHQKNKNVAIIISTPPPSLLKRKITNTLLLDYRKQLLQIKNCPVWDLYSKLGGAEAPKRKEAQTLMAKDKVHYTKEGYQLQGDMLSTDLINAYKNHIKAKSSDEHDTKHIEQTGY